MPIFEYVCQKCDHRFEQIVSGATVTKLQCPACQGKKLEKQLSVFSASHSDRDYRAGGRPVAPVAPCGTCGDPGGAGSC
ncbi:MAG TPA: zinc ribbon domain-containing protein, partial [Pyrinomonadaceae bacterium]|nr:zinc ribbon domain-containing protein [Pyrinomonadaceae bacterium]